MISSLTQDSATSGCAHQTEKPIHRVTENERSASLTVYLPGVRKKDINLRFEAGQLDLRAARPRRNKEDGWQARHREISEREFALRMDVGRAYDGQAIWAQHADGVLTIHVPRAAATLPRTISVTAE